MKKFINLDGKSRAPSRFYGRCFMILCAMMIAASIPVLAQADDSAPAQPTASDENSTAQSGPIQAVAPGSGANYPQDPFDPESVKNKDVVVVTAEGMLIRVGPILADFMKRRQDQKEGVQYTPTPTSAVELNPKRRNNINLTFRKLFKETGLNYLIVPFRWSGDTKRGGAAAGDFAKRLTKVYEAAHKYNKPVFVLAYSWGTMVSYEGLSRLADKHSPVRVAKYITMGSMIEPKSHLMTNLVDLENGGVRRKITKPDVVKEWYNFWARADMYSNDISAADINVRVDTEIDKIEDRLLAVPDKSPQYKQALEDRLQLLDDGRWHRSYFNGYYQTFPSINYTLSKDVFKSDIRPILMPF